MKVTSSLSPRLLCSEDFTHKREAKLVNLNTVSHIRSNTRSRGLGIYEWVHKRIAKSSNISIYMRHLIAALNSKSGHLKQSKEKKGFIKKRNQNKKNDVADHFPVYKNNIPNKGINYN